MKKIRSMLRCVFRKAYGLLAGTLLRKIPGIWGISNILFRAMWRNKNIIEIEGSKMYINVNDPNPVMRKTFQAYALNLIHEEATTGLFKEKIKKGDVVLDLGANIGYFSLLAANLVGREGKVFSFEPEPTNFRYLKKNIEINSYRNISAYQKAVSNINGKTKLFICPYDSGHHTIQQPDGIKEYRQKYRSEIKEIEIDTVALDGFLKDAIDKADIIKMDVEGAESLAFEGIKRILMKNQHIKIFLEFFPLLIEKMGNSPEGFIKQLLEEYHFSIFVIPRDYLGKNIIENQIKIQDPAQLMGLLKETAAHTNLYLTRDPGL